MRGDSTWPDSLLDADADDDDVAGINISARKQFVNKKLYQMGVGVGGGGGYGWLGDMHLRPAS